MKKLVHQTKHRLVVGEKYMGGKRVRHSGIQLAKSLGKSQFVGSSDIEDIPSASIQSKRKE